jgi:aminoglycoside phosphotransferase (APT) family kinase protein
MDEERAQRQLELIGEFAALAADAGIECWLRGGWALDFLLGRITRPHEDIDLFVWAADAPRLLSLLRQHGYEEVGGPPPEQQRNLVKAGEEFHVTLLERNEFGVVTAGGRWADSPWPAGMLDGPVGQIGDVRCRVISAEAQLWAKEEVPKALGHAQREHDPADIVLLRGAIARRAGRDDAPTGAELADIERRLSVLFPGLAVAPLRQFDVGFGSVVVETSDGVIFRVARHATAAEGHAREARLLPALQGRLPLAVPDPRWRVERGSPGFPHGAIGHRRLAGTPLSPVVLASIGTASVARQLAAFLRALHCFPVQEAEQLGLPHADHEPDILRAFRDEVLPPLREALAPEEYQTICVWWERLLADPKMWDFTPTLRHGDLWYDHVLVDELRGRLVGVVDWEAAALGDPARDFAAQFHVGEEFAEATLAAYDEQGGQIDQGLRHRVRRQWELREFGGIRTSVELNDREELQDAVRKLRAGPILSGSRRECRSG